MTTYGYDGDNMRKVRAQTAGADLFYHGPGGQLLSEFRRVGVPAARWVRDYVYLGGRLVASLGAPKSTIGFTVASSSVDESAGAVTLTVRLATPDQLPLADPASVSFTTLNGSASAGEDFTATSNTITFGAGSADQSTQTFQIPILDNHRYEGPQTFTVRLSNPQNARLGTADHVVTITDEADPQPILAVDTPAAGTVFS